MTANNRILYQLCISDGTTSFEANNLSDSKPFYTIDFDISKNPDENVSNASITISNLARNYCLAFAKEEIETQKNINLTLKLGNSKDGVLVEVLRGKIITCRTSGKPTTETKITVFPYISAGIYQNINVKKGQTIQYLKKTFADMLGLELNNQAGDGEKKLTTDYNEMTQDVYATARKYFKTQNVVIDGASLHFSNRQQKQQGNNDAILHLLANHNIVKQPESQGFFINVETFLQPQIKVGDKVTLNQQGLGCIRDYSGSYICVGVAHSGHISYRTIGDNRSNFTLR